MAALSGGREGHLPQAYRTVLCRYFQSGYCPAGDNCTFIHSSEDSPTPSTQQCKNFLMGSCKNGINCPFAHSAPQGPSFQQQPQAASYGQPQKQQMFTTNAPGAMAGNEYKMDLCPHRGTGACGGSAYCVWAHSVDELVPGKFSQEEIEALRNMARNGMGAASVLGATQHPQHPQAYTLMSPYGEVEGYGAPGTYAMTAASGGYAPVAYVSEQPQPGADNSQTPVGLYQAHRYLPPAAGAYTQSPYASAYAAPAPYAAAPVASYNSPLAHPKAKTKMCTFWPDRCRKGEQCPYIHGEDDPLHVGGPAARMQAVAMASMTSITHVPGAGAYFGGPALNQKRSRPSPSVIGTKFCKFFLVGACTRGSECTFSHDQRVRVREEQQRQQQQSEKQQQHQTEQHQQQAEQQQCEQQPQASWRESVEEPSAKRARNSRPASVKGPDNINIEDKQHLIENQQGEQQEQEEVCDQHEQPQLSGQVHQLEQIAIPERIERFAQQEKGVGEVQQQDDDASIEGRLLDAPTLPEPQPKQTESVNVATSQ